MPSRTASPAAAPSPPRRREALAAALAAAWTAPELRHRGGHRRHARRPRSAPGSERRPPPSAARAAAPTLAALGRAGAVRRAPPLRAPAARTESPPRWPPPSRSTTRLRRDRLRGPLPPRRLIVTTLLNLQRDRLDRDPARRRRRAAQRRGERPRAAPALALTLADGGDRLVRTHPNPKARQVSVPSSAFFGAFRSRERLHFPEKMNTITTMSAVARQLSLTIYQLGESACPKSNPNPDPNPDRRQRAVRAAALEFGGAVSR